MESTSLTTYIHIHVTGQGSKKLCNSMIVLDVTSVSAMIRCEFLVRAVTLPGSPVGVVSWSSE